VRGVGEVVVVLGAVGGGWWSADLGAKPKTPPPIFSNGILFYIVKNPFPNELGAHGICGLCCGSDAAAYLKSIGGAGWKRR